MQFLPHLRYGASRAALDGGAATDPHFANVVLLVSFNGTDGQTTATDDSNSAHALTFAGNAQIDDDVSHLGTGSLLLDGTGDYVTSIDSNDWTFGADPFTVEFSVRYNSVADAEFVSQWSNIVGSSGWKIGRLTGGLHLNFYDTSETLRSTGGEAWTPSTDTWYDVCVDRDGDGDVRRYVDGAMLGSAVNLPQTAANRATALSIGRIDHATPRYLNGWMNELRITKGVARYASDSGYTVPTGPFPRA